MLRSYASLARTAVIVLLDDLRPRSSRPHTRLYVCILHSVRTLRRLSGGVYPELKHAIAVTKLERQLRQSRSLSGGVSLCPGRHFAKCEIAQFVAGMLLDFDVLLHPDSAGTK